MPNNQNLLPLRLPLLTGVASGGVSAASSIFKTGKDEAMDVAGGILSFYTGINMFASKRNSQFIIPSKAIVNSKYIVK